MIPKTIIQTSRNGIPDYVKDMIRELSPGWEYKHFTDGEIIDFFRENPLNEFPDIINKFYSLCYGEHRADLFRYYYLYVKGGVFIDSDAMIEVPLDDIVKDNDFFSVNSSYFPGCIFQGFVGCSVNNQIIYAALDDIYHTNNNQLIENFHLSCLNLSFFINKFKNIYKVNLLQEVEGDELHADIKDGDKIVLKHWYSKKIIPNREPN